MTYITAYSECCLDTLACCDLFTERTRRPGAELLTPMPGSPILGLNIQGVRIATIFGEYVSVRYVDVFAEAVMQLAQDMQPADSRNRGETDLNLVMGQMICFCNIIDTPCRIELHFANGTGIKCSFKD